MLSELTWKEAELMHKNGNATACPEVPAEEAFDILIAML